MYYDNIPTIAIDTVRSLYQGAYVDLRLATTETMFSFIHTDSLVASLQLLASQFALMLSVLFGAFILFVVIQRRALKAQSGTETVSPAGAPPPVPAGILRDRWNAVLAHLDSPKESDWKLAVIEADTLVDDALARAGFPGVTFGDRLSNISPGGLTTLDGVWWAHKIRNRLAHEVDYFLRYTEARQAVGYFEAALAELQLI